DVEAYAAAGADGVLVGEALVTSGDPATAVGSYRRVARRGRPLPEGAQA
ncbi:MAG: indole-3-glycerol-phosphate synthase TrpC, partial [Brachybacterium sp.]|nr:indole-3-glycerol-phosphate synthase TrpC [Brachybacterium sp.]